ncbi:MAG: alanine--tRNA ligase, partial [Candidatus Eisenbacteria bacterium]|nr:alanine--tRNA ligase [Candidatus Eisenbacteria bacterium]
MSKALSTQEIRDQFTKFFVEREHRRVSSSPLVPADDPTLLFTSAGMVQFKAMYAAKGDLEYRRATTVQKCFRATDLEQVGQTPRHLTFFEMLGNFSFGDYFKREAIHWAWEFITEVLEMDTEGLWVTVYLEDDEAYDIWHKEIGVPTNRLVRLGDEDNFWGPAGASGACGPSSEIYMDLGEAKGCGGKECKPGCDCDRFQEFWNLVFPQYDQAPDGSRAPLANRGIDTGMGLERLAQLLQNVDSVFETDGFRPIRDVAMDLIEFDLDQEKHRTTLNILTEHARSVTMLFHEGVYPSNEGRGYVARRILRRAVRRGKMMGLNEPFLYKLTSAAIDSLIEAYPELAESRDRIAKMCKAEESRFFETLETGLRRFEELVQKTKAEGSTELNGRDVFTLYDTFGFPVDMTEEMAAEQGFTLDTPGFEKAMEEQVERSRANAPFNNDDQEAEPWTWLRDESAKHSQFTGYDTLSLDVTVVAKRKVGDVWEFLLESTPFYAEGGGQVADRGWLRSGENELEIIGVQKRGGLHLHRAKVSRGQFEGDQWTASVDESARRSTERNHTATHLLHAALKRVVGDHVTQAGSLVSPDRLRFDFNHFSALTEAQIQDIENDVNRAVLSDFVVERAITSMDEARASGAVAMFGEKYGDEVRQVFVAGSGAKEVSRELCGGCHVRRTGEIGLFRIVSEESVAAGIRRVEATTGWNAVAFDRSSTETLSRVGSLLK